MMIMKYKYGEFQDKQFHDYKQLLHNKVHWLLIYEETSYPGLTEYIKNLQFYLSGLVELTDSPQIVNLVNIIECILLEYMNPKHNHKHYRKLVLDAHSIIDQIPDRDGDSNE